MTKRILSAFLCLCLTLSAAWCGFALYSLAQNNLLPEHFYVKQDMEAFVNTPTTAVGTSGRWDNSAHPNNFAYSIGTGENAFGGSGQSVGVTYNRFNAFSGSQHFDYHAFVYNQDDEGVTLGTESRLGFWIKADQEMQLRLRVNDTDSSGGAGNRMESIWKIIPAGESYVSFDWSDFAPMTADTYIQKLDYIYTLYFFIMPVDKSNCSADGTFYIDSIGVEDLRYNEGEHVLHGDSFIAKQDMEAFDGDLTVKTGDAGRWLNSAYPNNFSYSIGTDFNAYGGSGQSAGVEYTGLNRFNGSAHFDYAAFVYNQDAAGAALGNDSELAFWVKSSQPIRLKLRANDSDSSGSGVSNRMESEWIEIPQGESIVTFSWDMFTPMHPESYTGTHAYLYTLYFYPAASDESVSDTGMLYIDQIGVNDLRTAEPTEKAYHSEGFHLKEDMEGYTDLTVAAGASGRWSNAAAPNRFAFKLGTGDNAYAGSGKSAGIDYKGLASFGTGTYVSFLTHIYLSDTDGMPLGEESDFAFWVKSDQPMKIKITANDSYNAGQHGNQRISSGWVEIPAGESIVRIPMSEFTPNDPSVYEKKMTYLYSLMFYIAPINASDCVSDGTLYIDQLGVYGQGETITLPAKHKDSFVEKLDMEGFADNPETEVGDSGRWLNSAYAQYFTLGLGRGADAYGGSGQSVSVSYTSFSRLGESGNVSYKAYLYNRNTSNQLMDDSSEIAFWVKTDQNIRIRIAAWDTYTEGKTRDQQLQSEWYIVPKGEGIVTIPLKSLIPTTPEAYEKRLEYLYTISFYIAPVDTSSCSDTGTLFIDAIGLNCSDAVIGSTVSYDADSYIWYGFDHIDDAAFTALWKVPWAGENNAGGALSLEPYPATGAGKSAQFVYNNKLSSNGVASMRFENKLYSYGDGLILRVYTLENTQIRIVAIDNTLQTVTSPRVDVFRGENILVFKWSDFTYMSADLAGRTPDMRRTSQLQVRPCGVNAGTIWVDDIGFTNVSKSEKTVYGVLNPSNSFAGWYNGNELYTQDFEGYAASDDEQFCIDWYFSNYTSWITLQNAGGNKQLRYDYDYTGNTSADLLNMTTYKNVDSMGGIRFWARMSDDRVFALRLCINNNYYQVYLKGSTAGRTYQIPFSAFSEMNNLFAPFTGKEGVTYNVTQIRLLFNYDIAAENSCASQKGTIWLDDIAFVDSAKMIRAHDIDVYKNGVRFIAGQDAFDSSVEVDVTELSLTDEERAAWSAAIGEDSVLYRMVSISALTTSAGRSVQPKQGVQLLFDVPIGVSIDDVKIYSADIDGTATDRRATVVDGKLSLTTYRLGEYIVAYPQSAAAGGNATDPGTAKPGGPADRSETDGSPTAAIIIAAAVIAVIAAGGVIFLIWKKRTAGKKGIENEK